MPQLTPTVNETNINTPPGPQCATFGNQSNIPDCNNLISNLKVEYQRLLNEGSDYLPPMQRALNQLQMNNLIKVKRLKNLLNITDDMMPKVS